MNPEIKQQSISSEYKRKRFLRFLKESLAEEKATKGFMSLRKELLNEGVNNEENLSNPFS